MKNSQKNTCFTIESSERRQQKTFKASAIFYSRCHVELLINGTISGARYSSSSVGGGGET
jgi:hypothetical protein